MRTFIIVFGCAVIAAGVLTAAFARRQQSSKACRAAVSVIYVLTLVGIVLAMSVLEGKYGMKMLYSSIIAALALATVCLGEFIGNRIKSDGKEE